MSRIVSSANATALAAADIIICVAVDLDFASGHVRAHDGIGTISIGGNSYQGIGQFGSIQTVEESTDIVARPVTLAISGVDSSLIATARDEVYQNRSATLYLAAYNTSTLALIDTPETIWEGRMNQMTITLAGDSSRIDLSCEHRLRREPRIARYTDADQKLAYSGDRFFDLLPKIPGFRGTWGAKGIANDGYTTGTVLDPIIAKLRKKR